MNRKPKEPLMAVIWALIFPGVGQLYAGRPKRALFFFWVPFIVGLIACFYVAAPNTKIYPVLLLPLAVVIGLCIYAIPDAYWCAREYNKIHNLQRKINAVRRTFLVVCALLVAGVFNPGDFVTKTLVFYLRDNFFQAFRMPAGSMKPSLLNGDRVLADKAIYKKSEPQRGDVVVFRYPLDRNRFFAKRIVGLPNETLEIKGGALLINGIQLKEPSVFGKIFYFNHGDFGAKGQAVKISANSYFVLGDNSVASHDSRYWGFVPRQDIVGKVYKIYFPFERSGPIH